jgi:hypothetical protein
VSRGGIEAKATDAILVSSLGAQARLECNCGADPVTVDGKPAGMISANTLNLPALNKGNKTIQVGERALVIGAQPEPVVNLFLTSNQDIGTLVIDTNVDNPTVIINKKRYQGTASEGLIRIPLNAARYKVSLHKQGYRNSEPQTVDIQKGGAGKLLIRLDPVNSAIQMPAGVASADDHNALEEARRNDEQADWDGVNKSDRAALQQYLDQHPGGRFAQDASSLIKGLEQAEKQRADQQKRDDDQRKARLAEEQRKAQEALRKSAQEEEQRKKAGEAAAHQQQLETQQRAAAERRAVLDVLNKYAAAYKSRDAGAVKAVFPEVPKFNTIVNSFKIFRSFDVTLEPAEPQITGESAVVRCRRTIRVADEYGTQPPRSDAVTFRMQKLSDRWVIVSLQ